MARGPCASVWRHAGGAWGEGKPHPSAGDGRCLGTIGGAGLKAGNRRGFQSQSSVWGFGLYAVSVDPGWMILPIVWRCCQQIFEITGAPQAF